MNWINPDYLLSVYPDGRVCISILHAPGDDPMGYESSAERWSPVQSVEKILLSVVSMLAEPNDESAANVDAAKTWRTDRQKFDDIARQTVRKSLGLWTGTMYWTCGTLVVFEMDDCYNIVHLFMTQLANTCEKIEAYAS